jgi:cytochrome c
MDRLAGGISSLASDAPVKTVGSYWPYATTVFDYIRRAMPLPTPGSLTADQGYAVTAYVLFLNGIVAEDDVIDAKSLPGIRMPNRDGFVPDARPDVPYWLLLTEEPVAPPGSASGTR